MEGMEGLADIYVLRRIVDNLASNVEKYADDSQPVKLEIQEEDRTVSIIQSNGIRTGEARQEKVIKSVCQIYRSWRPYMGELWK